MSEEPRTDNYEDDGELTFDLRLKEKNIFLVGEDGQKKRYIVRELVGDQRDEYLTFQFGKMKVSGSGKQLGMTDYKDVEAQLIQRCVFDADFPTDQLTLKTIRKWPARVQSEIVKLINEMSGLDRLAAEEAAKND